MTDHMDAALAARREAQLLAEDHRLDQLIENVVMAAYEAGLPDDPDVQAAVDELGEYIAHVRAA